MSIIYNNFNIEAAASFKATITDVNRSVYFHMSKDSPWPDESNPPAPIPNISAQQISMCDLIAAHRISTTDAVICIKRNDWVFGTVYDQYDCSKPTQAINETIYVITSEYNVYKCLGNNFGSRSEYEPSGTSIQPANTPDGYLWKYMLTVPRYHVEKFLNEEFIPIKDAPIPSDDQWLVESNAVRGAIESFDITSKGSFYTYANIEIIGDGIGAEAVALIQHGKIINSYIANRGYGYTWAYAVISGDGGGAEIIPQIAPGGGHGSNAARELGGHYLMITSDFMIDDNNNIPERFTFRKVGIIADIVDSDDNPVVNYVISGCYKIYADMSVFNHQDDLLFRSGKYKGKVVAYGEDTGGTYLLLTEICNPRLLTVGDDFIDANNSSKTGTVTSIIPPDINRFSKGLPLYVSHRQPIIKNINQVEYAKFVVEF